MTLLYNDIISHLLHNLVNYSDVFIECIPQTYTGGDLPACKHHAGVPIFHEGYV